MDTGIAISTVHWQAKVTFRCEMSIKKKANQSSFLFYFLFSMAQFKLAVALPFYN